MRANAVVSTRADAASSHSGKYSWAVASRVKAPGATGSPLKITVVIPDAFSLAMICAADCWMDAGSSWYGRRSEISTPCALRLATNSSAIAADSALDSMYTRPYLRGVDWNCSPAYSAFFPASCLPMNSETCTPIWRDAAAMPKLYGSRSRYQSTGCDGLQLTHSTPRDESSSPNAAVSVGPPSTAKGLMSSAMRTASARAATSSEAMPLPTKNSRSTLRPYSS